VIFAHTKYAMRVILIMCHCMMVMRFIRLYNTLVDEMSKLLAFVCV